MRVMLAALGRHYRDCNPIQHHQTIIRVLDVLPRKVWRQLRREGFTVARGTVERLRRTLGLQDVRRGTRCRTTAGDDCVERPVDRVNRQFTATRPNELWMADFTYVATWVGFVYVAFVVNVFARRIIGWRTSSSTCWIRLSGQSRSGIDGVIPHSDQGRQYLSIRYTERLTEAGAVPSVGSVGTPTTTPSSRRSSGCTRWR